MQFLIGSLAILGMCYVIIWFLTVERHSTHILRKHTQYVRS